MIEPFRVVKVRPDQAEASEPLGTKGKFWYRDGEIKQLFKANKGASGEDWAEKVGSELAAMIGLPHAEYDLAVNLADGSPGVVTPNFVPEGASLELGNQLLFAADSAYPADGSKYKVAAHTVDAVAASVAVLGPPPAPWIDGVPAAVQSALDVFAGFAMFDAWIANQDRHHENWAAVRIDSAASSAPSFDHGAGLARNLTDLERRERLATKDRGRTVAAFARKGASAFFESATDRKTLTAFAACREFARRVPEAAAAWLARIRSISRADLEAILARVPTDRLSFDARAFTLELLLENQRRLDAGEGT